MSKLQIKIFSVQDELKINEFLKSNETYNGVSSTLLSGDKFIVVYWK